MRQRLKRAWLMAKFRPSVAAIFINPYYLVRRRLFVEIRALAPFCSGTILDFGAGAAPYKDLFTSASRYVTVDVETSGHPREEQGPDFHYDGKSLPFQNGEFDWVFSSEVFEHIFNLEEILGEIARVLGPQGQLLITLPFVWPEHEVPYDFARYTSFGIESLLKRHGFEILRLKKTSNFVETIAQLIGCYFVQIAFVRRHVILEALATLLIAAPANILGALLGRLLPRQKSLFLNQVIHARKM